jgi:hypothetical protein
MLPYVATLVVLVLYAVRERRQAASSRTAVEEVGVA